MSNSAFEFSDNAYVERMLQHCDTLAYISEMEDGILRQYLTAAHKQCNTTVAGWMTEAGMQTWQDEVGNQWGRLASKNADAPRLIIGSHLDTVPNAGAFDGILGVLMGIELAAYMRDNAIDLPFHIDVVGFCDEEGTRYGVTLIGSRALAGTFVPDWLDIEDPDGKTMRDAMIDFGLQPEDFGKASLQGENIAGYWEIHIEQGPVLEAEKLSIGVVTAIAGARRGQIRFKGLAGHAGTTPMHLRKDALCGAAELTLAIEKMANDCNDDRVATVGEIGIRPGAVNVIPGAAVISLDVRSQFDDKRDQLIDDIAEIADTIASGRHLSIEWQWHHKASSVPCNKDFQKIFADAMQAVNLPVRHLPSGAGHDAMAIADLCEVAMLFIRSPRGLSHHPEESVIAEDVVDAFHTMCQAIQMYKP